MKTCPECGGPVESDLACHTWSRTRDDGTEQWRACVPCDSATRWVCAAWKENEEVIWEDECTWYWIEGLNPNNPRAEDNEAKNPRWEKQ